MNCLGWLSDLQLLDEKVTLNHLEQVPEMNLRTKNQHRTAIAMERFCRLFLHPDSRLISTYTFSQQHKKALLSFPFSMGQWKSDPPMCYNQT